MVETDASATLGRKVTLEHLHVRLGRTTLIAADKIAIANPKGFDGNLATIDQLVIEVDVMGYIHNRVLTLSKIVVEHPVADVRQLPDGTNNYTLQMKSSGSSNSKPTQIGNLYIHNGTASVVNGEIQNQYGPHDPYGAGAG